MKAAGHGMRNLNDEAAMWPTATLMDTGDNTDLEKIRARRQKHKARAINGNGFGKSLAETAREWPTPAARDHKGANSTEHVTTNGTGRMHMDQLPNFVEHGSHCARQDPPTCDGEPSSDARRNLNPRFVEWLMGWPIGWTDCAPAATALSPWLLRSRGALSMLSSRPTPVDMFSMLEAPRAQVGEADSAQAVP